MTDTSSVMTSGGLISTHFIESIRQPKTNQPGCTPEWFAPPGGGPPKPRELEENIATSWELLREQWDAVRGDLYKMDTPIVRRRWLRHLFDVLDFDLDYQRGDTMIGENGGLRFSISHRGWKGDGAPPIHTVSPSQSLDERPPGRVHKGKSPHDMLQFFDFFMLGFRGNRGSGPHTPAARHFMTLHVPLSSTRRARALSEAAIHSARIGKRVWAE